MPIAKTGFTMNADGTINYNQTAWDSFWNGTNADAQAYALEYNQALKQYDQQYALQKEAQQANLQNMQFNQNLANRQQALSEESYYNGVLNQAAQLSKLGINPAATGNVSGATMSGGSNVSGVPSGSASGRNPGSHNFQAKAMQQLQMLTFLTSLAKQRSDITLQDAQAKAVSKQADVAQQNADTNARNSDINKRNSDIQAMLAGANVSYINAQTENINSQTAYNRIFNDNYSALSSVVNPETLKALRGVDYKTMIGAGIIQIFGALAGDSDPDDIQVATQSVVDLVDDVQDSPESEWSSDILYQIRLKEPNIVLPENIVNELNYHKSTGWSDEDIIDYVIRMWR